MLVTNAVQVVLPIVCALHSIYLCTNCVIIETKYTCTSAGTCSIIILQ